MKGANKLLGRNTYVVDMCNYLSVVSDYIAFPVFPWKDKKGHRRIADMSNCSPKNCSLAINRVRYGDASPHSIHDDAVVFGACVVSACSDSSYGQLQSAETNPGATGGELFHEIGGLVYGYGERDLIFFNGAHYHGPFMPHPSGQQQGNKKNKAGRYSFVVFRSGI